MYLAIRNANASQSGAMRGTVELFQKFYSHVCLPRLLGLSIVHPSPKYLEMSKSLFVAAFVAGAIAAPAPKNSFGPDSQISTSV
jgi:hypothetical protein